jgi:hypothetical protein
MGDMLTVCSCRVVVGLLSDSYRTNVGLLSDSYRTNVGLGGGVGCWVLGVGLTVIGLRFKV